MRTPFVTGSNTNIYTTRDRSLIVKVVSQGKPAYKELLWRDMAGLIVMSGSDITPEIHYPHVSSSVSDDCVSRMLVMENAGSNTLSSLYDFYSERGLSIPMRMVREIGRAALALIKGVHTRGIIHGDIHWMNFVYRRPDFSESLRLIDFGRSTPYTIGTQVDAIGVDDSVAIWNPQYLSPNEIQSGKVSRADDVFRVAEMLVNLLEGDTWIYVPLANGPYYRGLMTRRRRRQAAHRMMNSDEIVDYKTNRRFKSTTPNEIRAFYLYSISLDYDDEPDYDRWFQ